MLLKAEMENRGSSMLEMSDLGLFENAPDAYLVTDRASRILSANRAAVALLGAPGEGARLLDAMPAPSREQAEAHLVAIEASGSVEQWEGELSLPEGERTPVSFRVGALAPMRDATVLGWVVRDLSETERRVRALTESERRLESLNSLKDTFLRSVSHDLRGPLAAVIALAQTLAREDVQLDPADVRDLLQRMLKSAQQMKSLLTDLLDLDRLTEGYVGTSSEPLSLDQLARHAVAQLDPERQGAVEVRGSGLRARVDRAVLERILANLLDNALRYASGNGKVWIGFAAGRRSDDVILSVDDQGPGVEDDAKEAIFDPFVRAQSSGSVSGTGMGLALVERFAGLLGGRAWVEDRPGGGASFKVLLPGCLEAEPATE